MDDITIVRALHVLAVVHWIGGIAMVTLVLLPVLRETGKSHDPLQLFEILERRFSRQAKFSVSIAGLSGLYLTHRLHAWDRFLEPAYWWMHAMLLIWLVFLFILFIAEPRLLHTRFRQLAQHNPDAMLRLLQASHWLLLSLSAGTVAAAVLGAHGLF